MLPIKTSLKAYKKGESAKFTLEKEGPCTVYSKDIKSKDPDTEIIGKKIPLVKLAKGQKVKMEMTAILSTGREHSKWQPAIVGFRNTYKITVDKECSLCEQCVKQCPKNILESKAKKIVLTDALECNACAACRDSCEKGLIKIETEPDSFMLFIESNGQLENEEILLKAIEALQEKVSEFKKSISSLKE
jgi:DNA-directed RNA polymerase subunit D